LKNSLNISSTVCTPNSWISNLLKQKLRKAFPHVCTYATRSTTQLKVWCTKSHTKRSHRFNELLCCSRNVNTWSTTNLLNV